MIKQVEPKASKKEIKLPSPKPTKRRIIQSESESEDEDGFQSDQAEEGVSSDDDANNRDESSEGDSIGSQDSYSDDDDATNNYDFNDSFLGTEKTNEQLSFKSPEKKTKTDQNGTRSQFTSKTQPKSQPKSIPKAPPSDFLSSPEVLRTKPQTTAKKLKLAKDIYESDSDDNSDISEASFIPAQLLDRNKKTQPGGFTSGFVSGLTPTKPKSLFGAKTITKPSTGIKPTTLSATSRFAATSGFSTPQKTFNSFSLDDDDDDDDDDAFGIHPEKSKLKNVKNKPEFNLESDGEDNDNDSDDILSSVSKFPIPVSKKEKTKKEKQTKTTLTPQTPLNESNNINQYKELLPGLLYKKDFVSNREEMSKSIYKVANQTVFKNALPLELDIVWSKSLLTTAGYVSFLFFFSL